MREPASSLILEIVPQHGTLVGGVSQSPNRCLNLEFASARQGYNSLTADKG